MPWAFVSQQHPFHRDVSLFDLSESHHKIHLAVLRGHETSMKRTTITGLKTWGRNQRKKKERERVLCEKKIKPTKMQNSLLQLSTKRQGTFLQCHYLSGIMLCRNVQPLNSHKRRKKGGLIDVVFSQREHRGS